MNFSIGGIKNVPEWKINNHSKRQFAIQRNDNEISIVEPQNNGSFKILAEIDTHNQITHVHDPLLYVSADTHNAELNIFDHS